MNRAANYSHLLLTRFNLHYATKTEKYICDEEWHEERFELFNQYCLPSVVNQTNSKFEWIIFFNEDKRERYRDFITETRETLQNIRFLFVKPGEDHRKSLIEYIHKNYSSDYLITTRIDNDDSISIRFIESIQNKFLKNLDTFEKDYIINAGSGYQFEVKFPFRKALIENYPYSPFISLCSKRNSSKTFSTVLENSHPRWKEFAQSEELSTKPFWTQVIHTKNRANKVLSFQLLPRVDDQNFPALHRVSKNNYWFGLLMLPLQFFITFLQRIVEKIRKSF